MGTAVALWRASPAVPCRARAGNTHRALHMVTRSPPKACSRTHAPGMALAAENQPAWPVGRAEGSVEFRRSASLVAQGPYGLIRKPLRAGGWV